MGRLINLVLLIVVLILLVLAAIVMQSYNGRVLLVNAQRAGCYRGQQNTHANIEAWYAAYLARRQQAQLYRKTNPMEARQDAVSASVYLNTVRVENSHTSPAFSLTWPKGSSHHPLGVGHLECDRAYPAPTLNPFAQ